MAAIVGGRGNDLGESLATGDVMENIFGLTIMNDWSARFVGLLGCLALTDGAVAGRFKALR